MGIQTELRNVTGVPQVNYFEITHYDISNRGAGVGDAVLMVWWRAYLRTPTPTPDDPAAFPLRLAKECGPADFAGEALRALCADADARTQAYKAMGVDAGAAYALGQRDAIYAVLQAVI